MVHTQLLTHIYSNIFTGPSRGVAEEPKITLIFLNFFLTYIFLWHSYKMYFYSVNSSLERTGYTILEIQLVLKNR